MPHSLFINKTNDSLKDDWEYGVGHSNPFKTPLEKLWILRVVQQNASLFCFIQENNMIHSSDLSLY